jgi:hypothetical protein
MIFARIKFALTPSEIECGVCMITALLNAGFWECFDCIPESIPDQGGGGHRECCERDPRTGRCIVFKPLGGVCP